MAYLQFLSSRATLRMYLTLFLVVFLGVIIFAPECAAWIFFHKPEYKGKVIDAETGEPIEGVAVVAVYRARNILGGPAGPNSWEINWKETVTDEKGVFRIPSYTTLVGPNSKEEETRFIFYKPGYRRSPAWPGRDFLWILGSDNFFTEEIGKRAKKEFGIKKDEETIKYGIVPLKKANTWEERKRSMPSPPFESKKDELPEIYNYMDNEREWLRQNKEWRRNEESK